MSNMHKWAKRFSQTVAPDTDMVDIFNKWIQTADEHYSYPKIANGGQECVPDEPGLYIWGADRTVDGKWQIVPRYVGRAESTLTLKKRFLKRGDGWQPRVGRYVLGPGVPVGDFPPQGVLACHFHDKIRNVLGAIANSVYAHTLKPLHLSQSPVMRGLAAFPPDMVASFNSKEPGHPGSDLRLRHAVDWALHGGPNLEHLWVAFLPGIAHLEGELRAAAIRWRRGHSLAPLLNQEDK